MNLAFHELCVADVRRECKGTRTIVFDVPVHLTDVFAWRAGQHVTLRAAPGGEEIRRSYSISVSPMGNDPLQITVRRVKGGIMSNYLVDDLSVGDRLEVMPPFGGFCLDPGQKLRRTHYFFAAGSGITPIYAMVQTVLTAEPFSAVVLIYGNRYGDAIIFEREIDELTTVYAGRFSVQHVLSRPSMWSSFTPWRRGNIDAAAVTAAINENPPYAQDTQYFVCGPGDMNGVVRAALVSLDVPQKRIHGESFGGVQVRDDTVHGIAATAQIKLAGKQTDVAIRSGQTILDAARGAGLAPPFSCQSGVCGACRAHVAGGSVHMRAHMALEPAEIAAGTVLACQSVPTSNEVRVDFG